MTTVVKRSNLEVWRDVIFALFTREIRTGFSDKLGLSWALINPIIFIFILSFVRGRMDGGDTHGVPTFVFMAYGLTYIQMFLQTLQGCSSSIKKNKPLFAFRQVQPISAVIAAAMFQLMVKVFVVVGIVTIMYFLGIEISVDNPLLLLYCFFSLWWLAVMFGLLFGTLIAFVPEISKLMDLMTRPLFFISATFFALQDFPREYWHYLDWNPVLHAIELTRYAAYNAYGDDGVSVGYLSMVTLITTFFALSIYYTNWRQAISR